MKKIFHRLGFFTGLIVILAVLGAGCCPVSSDSLPAFRQGSLAADRGPDPPGTTVFDPTETCPDASISTVLVGEQMMGDDEFTDDSHFQIEIVFNEEIVLAETDPADWLVEVNRQIDYLGSEGAVAQYVTEPDHPASQATVLSITQIDPFRVLLTCSFQETPFASTCFTLFSVTQVEYERLRGDQAVGLDGALGPHPSGIQSITLLEGEWVGWVNAEFRGTLCGDFTGTIDGEVFDGFICEAVQGRLEGDFEGSMEGRMISGEVEGFFEGSISGSFSGTMKTPFETICPAVFEGLILDEEDLAGYFASGYGHHPDWPHFEPSIERPWQPLPDEQRNRDRIVWKYTGDTPPIFNLYGLSCFETDLLSGAID